MKGSKSEPLGSGESFNFFHQCFSIFCAEADVFLKTPASAVCLNMLENTGLFDASINVLIQNVLGLGAWPRLTERTGHRFWWGPSAYWRSRRSSVGGGLGLMSRVPFHPSQSSDVFRCSAHCCQRTSGLISTSNTCVSLACHRIPVCCFL